MSEIKVELTHDQVSYLKQVLMIEKFGLEALVKDKPHLKYLSKNLTLTNRIRSKLTLAQAKNS